MVIGNFNKLAMSLLLLILFFTEQVMASDQATFFKDVSEVTGADGWNQDQHLYIKGNLGVSKQSLNALEKWLDENGKNWTVILMQNARGQSWKDTRGYNYYGMDAVENAVGRGLSNNPKFAALVDASDNKRNGAIFVLFLEERKFSYFGEEAYDSRFLGENAWRGNLDNRARQAMRNGSGVVNAAKDTVKSIDGKLKQAKAREAQKRERAKLEKKETQAWIIREAASMQTNLKSHAQQAGVIKANAAAQEGDLANPPINDWQQVINEAKGNPNPFLAKQALFETARKMKNHRQAMQNWHSFPGAVVKLEGKVSQFIADKSFPEAVAIMTDIKKMIQVAKQLHTKGEQNFQQILNGAQNKMLDLIEKNEIARANRIRQEEHEEVQREAKRVAAYRRQQMIKNTAIGGGSLGGLGLLGFGIYSNRRRKKRKLLAEQLYEEWKEAMSDRVDKLFKVMDRAAIVVGSERDLPERGYEGETLSHSLTAIRNVDKAFVLSASVDKALNEAQELIYPSGFASMTVNVLSRQRYDEALDLLERKPLGSHLSVDEIKVMDRGEEQMLGSRANMKNMELGFSELIAEFDATVSTADENLDIVEDAWATIGSRVEELGSALSAISEKDELLEDLANDDGLFQLDSLFDDWLPMAESFHIAGIDVGKNDPVSALNKELVKGDRMAAEMDVMISNVIEFRESELEEIEDGTKNLHELHRRNGWVMERLKGFDEELDALSQRGMNEPVEEFLADQKVSMFALRGEVNQACKLAKMSLATLPKLIEKSESKTSSARTEIAKDLDLSEEKILKEIDVWNPDFLLAEAERLRISTQQCLDAGKTEQAQYLADQAQKNIDETNAVITDALLANSNYERDYLHVKELLGEADELKDSGVKIMSDLVGEYSRSALLVDPENKNAGNFIEVEEALQGAHSQLKKDILTAQDFQQKGWVLHASQSIDHAKSAHEHIRGMHEFIAFRQRELADLEKKNLLILNTHERDLLSLEETLKDPRVTLATQRFSRELHLVFEQVQSAVNPEHGESNPFAAEILLDEMKQRVLALETRIQGDREAFAAAEVALARLVDLQEQGISLTRTSQTDGISDSEQTLDCASDIEKAAGLIEAHQEIIVEPHNNWSNLYDEIHSTFEFLSSAVFSLRQDIEAARSALANIRSASRNVSNAMNWSGSYGVSIMGGFGSDQLDLAERALDSGDYQRAGSYASAAMREARSAISAAESKVASIRHQREEAERARRRARRRASSFSSGSSFGSRSGSSSSFGISSSSGGSGFSRSSSSSGSGFTRSGW